MIHAPLFLIRAITAVLVATDMTQAAEPTMRDAVDACRTIANDAARLRCFEAATRPPAEGGGQAPSQFPPLATPPSAPNVTGGWRLVRVPRPEGGDSITMMHTADSRSDANFAGVSLRCGDKGLQTMLIVIEPFPLRSKPTVSIATPGGNMAFSASVLPPGAIILLPGEVSDLIRGPWKGLANLSVRIEADGRLVSGSVPLTGIEAVSYTHLTLPTKRIV